MEFGGIHLIGLNSRTALKLGLTLALVGGLFLIRLALAGIVRITTRQPNSRAAFWTRQAASLAALVVLLAAGAAIWFDDPARLTTVVGLITAGVAIAAQKVVTSFAGYLVIMRGKTFTIGDRIKMGGVRGDVISLGFLQTRILEMGQPAEVNEQEDPGMWVRARQFTGRIVTITNDKIFDEPVYNFTREFPFIWEELHVPIPYRADRAKAEQILLDAVRVSVQAFERDAARARQRIASVYGVQLESEEPRAFWRLTDNWLEMTVRFIVPEHGIREIKDQITRKVLADFRAAGLEIGSTTMEVTLVKPA